MLPKSNVNPQQVDAFMNQERNKRRELLQKFLNLCMASKVHTLNKCSSFLLLG
ncbi:hypothetical protein MA16_Dca005349 [Dendrobium catenatum]|uniref:Uncharacterized protein n=1 Tax=Dendrobium catenatum TaxID=906689 RepID=A0A2I0X352_9ASPA|nr:hypothetical protein MA16_Dca005349 [Dendrobium catenatum]